MLNPMLDYFMSWREAVIKRKAMTPAVAQTKV
jgi:hypothetical protein